MPLPALPALPALGFPALRPNFAPSGGYDPTDPCGGDPTCGGGGGGYNPYDPFNPFQPSQPSPGGPSLYGPNYPTYPPGGSAPPVTTIGSGSGSGSSGSSGSSGGFVSGIVGSALGYLFGGSLLRIALFILGLICIAGAIYLYKPTNQLVVQPARRAAGHLAAAAIAE